MLRIVRSAGMTLLNLINDILDFSKIEAGKLQLSAAPFAPRELVQRAAELFALKAQEKHLTLSVSVEPDVPAHLLADDQRLFQIITNLVSNALKFTEQGGVSIAAAYSAGQLEVTVIDSGIGMSEEQQTRLFAPFEQADRSTTRRYGGTGLGLAICRNLAELMGGRIEARSSLGKGSTFILRVPVEIPEDSAVNRLREARSRAPRGRLALVGRHDGPRSGRVEALREAGFHAEGFDPEPQLANELESAAVDLLLIEVEHSATVEASLSGAARWLAELPRLLLCGAQAGGALWALPYAPLESHARVLPVARRLIALVCDERPARVRVAGAGPEWVSALRSLLGDFAIDVDAAAGAADVPTGPVPAALLLAPEASASECRALLRATWFEGEPAPLLMCLADQAIACCEALPAPSSEAALALGRERVGRPLRQRARRDARGEALIKQWRDAQPMPELAQLVGNGISRLLLAVEDIVGLAEAQADAGALHRAAHSLKGWAGTLRMDQVYEPAAAIDSLASAVVPHWSGIARHVLALCAVSDQISRRYLGGPVMPAGEAPSSVKLEVLVVEDNPMNQQYMEKLLARHQIRCEIAENGREALACLARRSYDAVLLDMEMPVMDGRETIRAIRADPALSRHHVIALTAHAVDGAAAKFIKAGCDDYLAKPIDADLLLAKLRACMPGV